MICFQDVSFQYEAQKEKAGVTNINFTIKPGEFVLFCGLSGSGKSTISRLINGLASNFYEGRLAGEILLAGKDIKNKPLYEISQSVASVFQNPRSQFFATDTNGELAFGCENMGLPVNEIDERVEEAVSFFHVENLLGRNLFCLSGGEKQRIACASSYSMDPDIFVLDEPSSNLDYRSIEDLKIVLTKIKEQGKTVVIIEHRLYYLMDLVDRVFYMEDGSIKEEFSNAQFRRLNYATRSKMGLRIINFNELYEYQGNCKACSVSSGQQQFELENVSVTHKNESRGKRKVLNIPRLALPQHEIIALIGHNGAGKSTLARTICGLQKHAKGTVRIERDAVARKKRIHKSYLVMQDVNHQLFTENVKEELILGMKNPDYDKFNQILEKMDLSQYQEQHPMALSGGQKQRVAIAAAMTSGKEVIILDEPTSGLDYRQMVNFSELLQEVSDTSKITMVITHDIEFIINCCTVVVKMEAGNVAEVYSKRDGTLTTEHIIDVIQNLEDNESLKYRRKG